MSPILAGLAGISVRGFGHFGPVRDTGAMFPLQVITVGATATASITFSNIPATYSHLQIRAIARTNVASTADYPQIRFNSDSGSNYAHHLLYGDGSAAGAAATT